ncbi:MAG TPA: glycosyltransferase family 4 protein [Chloroflexota bacterium]
MRIAYIVADGGIPIAGTKGASVHVREMVRALAQRHAVDLFCANPGEGKLNLPVEHLTVARRPARRTSADEAIERDRRRLETVGRLRCLVERAHEDAPYDLLYERYSLFGDIGASMSEDYNVPVVLEVNAPLIVERGRVEPLPLAPLAREIEWHAFERSTAVLSVSEAMQSYVLAHGGRPGHVHVVPNGVDTTRFHPGISGDCVRAELGLHGKLVVGFAGSLKAWHGVDLLLDAFARAATHGWTLLVVGDGPRRAGLEAQAEQIDGGGRIVFTGAVPHERMPEYLAAMDIAVAPYRPIDDFYFSPLKLFEYLAMGKPVVASNVGQIATTIQHGQNGYLVEPDDVQSLAAALLKLATDADLRAQMGAAGSDGAMTWEEIADRAVALGLESTAQVVR